MSPRAASLTDWQLTSVSEQVEVEVEEPQLTKKRPETRRAARMCESLCRCGRDRSIAGKL